MTAVLMLIAAVQTAPNEWTYSFGQSDRVTPQACYAMADKIKAQVPPGVEIIATCEMSWRENEPPSGRKRK